MAEPAAAGEPGLGADSPPGWAGPLALGFLTGFAGALGVGALLILLIPWITGGDGDWVRLGSPRPPTPPLLRSARAPGCGEAEPLLTAEPLASPAAWAAGGAHTSLPL